MWGKEVLNRCDMKKLQIAKTEVYARFMNVVQPAEDGKGPLRVQASGDGNGKLHTVQTNARIFSRVRGTRSDDNKKFNLGLRGLTRVKFRCHFDSAGIMQAMDLIPNRLFTSGPAPVSAGDARKKGFEVHVDEELNGFDVWSEDKDGEPVRIAYAGMSEQQLCDVLDAIRSHTWGNKKTATLAGHKVERADDVTFRVKAIGDVKYST